MIQKTTWKQYWPIISTVAVIAICYATFLIKPKASLAENDKMPITSLSSYHADANKNVAHVSISSLSKPSAIAKINKIPNETQLVSLTIQPKQTLSKLLSHYKISYTQQKQILKNTLAHQYLSHLNPQQKMSITLAGNQIQQLTYTIDGNKTLLVKKVSDGFQTTVASKPETVVLLHKSGVIHHSLLETARRSGLSQSMYHQLAHIFHDQIDTSHLTSHDHFSILYKEYYVDGKKVRPGDIVAAELTTHDQDYKAIRFSDAKRSGYFTPSGHSLEPGFLSAPLHYKRISSHFTYHRYDPVLHRVHAHLGIDYAAPEGTPIHTIGDGKIVFEGYRSGYGRSMVVRYNQKYESLYAHLARFAKSIHMGKSVKEGQVIGYVGESGWATGPHLHYELHVNGKPQDPLRVKLPGKASIPHKELPQFYETAHTLLAQLKGYDEIDFAENDNSKLDNEAGDGG